MTPQEKQAFLDHSSNHAIKHDASRKNVTRYSRHSTCPKRRFRQPKSQLVQRLQSPNKSVMQHSQMRFAKSPVLHFLMDFKPRAQQSASSRFSARYSPTASCRSRLQPLLQLIALQIGDYSTSNTHDVSKCRTEVVIPRSCSSPHLVVLQQIWVDEHTQMRLVTKGRHANLGLSNPSITRCCHAKSLTKTTLTTGKIIPSTASLNGTTLLMMRAGSSAPDDTRSSTGLAVAHACTRPIS